MPLSHFVIDYIIDATIMFCSTIGEFPLSNIKSQIRVVISTNTTKFRRRFKLPYSQDSFTEPICFIF